MSIYTSSPPTTVEEVPALIREVSALMDSTMLDKYTAADRVLATLPASSMHVLARYGLIYGISIYRRGKSRHKERRAKTEPPVTIYTREQVEVLVETLSAVSGFELTPALLATEFSLGHGETVTWGEATVAQFQQRLDMLETHVAGTLTTCGQVRAGIRTLRRRRKPTLNHC
jgi:aryl-alcohol dehydrogenase-like predicted oxidoreductase